MLSPFLTRIDRAPLLSDGAIGTMLYEHGISYGRSFDELNLSDPARVSAVHLEYLRSGAELLTTNTFGANRVRLAEFGLQDRVRDINLRGVKIARDAREIAGRPAFLAGSVGPVGRLHGETVASHDELFAAFREQMEALLEGGADVFTLETFTDVEELVVAVRAARAISDLPVIAQMTFGEDNLTLFGQTPEEVVEVVLRESADVIGINCSVGPQGALEVVQRMVGAGAPRVSAQPNAGLPSRRGQHFLYISTPEYFAEYAQRFAAAGARMIGGCCGTTPRHTAAMAAVIDRPAVVAPTPVIREAPAPQPAPRSEAPPTRLASALRRGDFVVSVEVDPPKGLNPTKTLDGARFLAEQGVQFINIGDSPMARVRMSCIALAKLIQECTPIETIIHFTTRDRNLMALQSELIGAHAMGIRNVIALTGDPPSLGDYPDATGVWDIDSVGLIEVLTRMNSGVDRTGRPIGGQSGFCIAAAIDPTAEDLEFQLERLRQKLDAGAHLIMSQPLYEVESLERFLDASGPIRVPFLLGVLPLQSYKHAEFMHNEVPGIRVPEEMRRAMHEAGPDGIRVGVELAQQLVSDAQHLVQGVYLMPSFGRYEMCAEIINALDLDRQPVAGPQPLESTAPQWSGV